MAKPLAAITRQELDTLEFVLDGAGRSVGHAYRHWPSSQMHEFISDMWDLFFAIPVE